MGVLKDCVPLEFVTLTLVYSESPEICELQFRSSYADTGSGEVSALVNGDFSVSTCLSSNLGDSSLSCDLASQADLRRVVHFSVC